MQIKECENCNEKEWFSFNSKKLISPSEMSVEIIQQFTVFETYTSSECDSFWKSSQRMQNYNEVMPVTTISYVNHIKFCFHGFHGLPAPYSLATTCTFKQPP